MNKLVYFFLTVFALVPVALAIASVFAMPVVRANEPEGRITLALRKARGMGLAFLLLAPAAGIFAWALWSKLGSDMAYLDKGGGMAVVYDDNHKRVGYATIGPPYANLPSLYSLIAGLAGLQLWTSFFLLRETQMKQDVVPTKG